VISFEFVANHFDELEADFQREYGIDLREALYGVQPVGGRRLTALINGLTPSSLTMRRLYSEGTVWGTAEELLATLVEQLDMSNRMYHAVHFEGDVWPPLRIQRPYAEEAQISSPVTQEPQKTDPDEVRSFFGTMAAGESTVVEPLAAKFADCTHQYIYFDNGAKLYRCQLCDVPVEEPGDGFS